MKKRIRWPGPGRQVKTRSLSGYAAGRSLRTFLSRRVNRLGKALNAGQRRMGFRTTGALLALLWMVALCYFVNILLSFIKNL